MKRVFAVILTAVVCLGDPVLAVCPSADLSGDCVVDFSDFSLLADQWLSTYDQNDLLTMVSQWLAEGIPADPADMVWVHINDPGVSGHEPFNGCMSKYLTTNAQYCRYLNAAKASNQITVYNNIVYATSNSQLCFYTYPADLSSPIAYSGGTFSICNRDGYSMDNHPVTSVSWYGAVAFCDYYGYRLPTEWEWQAVADYDGSYTYGCGTKIDRSMANYYDRGYVNPLGLTSFPYTSPVGYYPAYGYGLCDMAGNVWEWTSSVSILQSGENYRVVRGGGWSEGDNHCSVSFWSVSYLCSTNIYVGFRVCR